jgi:4-hydroxybenzoate polyprenyltransferase
LVDVEADRHHPVKRKRPIASGAVPPSLAKAMIAVLLLVALGGAALGPTGFVLVAIGYLALQTAYSFKLKQYPWIDVVCIAAGFVLRVLAGGYAIGTPVSGYMLACTALLALFLGFGKRRHELASDNPEKQRKALRSYSERALFWALAITGLSTVVTYTAYTLDPHTQTFFRSEYLWLTALHPLLGVLRFLQIVQSRPDAESPTQEILRDTPFVLNVVIWIVEVVVILYRLRPT